MGWRLERTYALTFEGVMAEAEVKIRATTIETCIKLKTSVDAAEMAALLADHVTSWNLDDLNGEPLAITAEAIVANLEEVVLAEILRQWYLAAVGVTAPLESPSSDGGDSKPETSTNWDEIPAVPNGSPPS